MKKKILFGVCLITGLLFINGGLNKFLNYMPVPPDLPEAIMRDFQAITEIVWLMPLLGLAEITGGLLLIIPKTRALGALVLFPVFVGILLTHIFVDTSGLPIAIIIGAVLFWTMYENRSKYLPLVS